MKRLYLFTDILAVIAIILLGACDQGPVRASYSLQFPDLPIAWQEILGSPHWRIQWVNTEGKWSDWDGAGGFPDLPLMQEWTSPVICWPYWPEKGLYPGQMSPCGGLFPWDASGDSLVLSWEAGVDAFLWQQFAFFQEMQTSGTPRYPWYFDWPRFRELMESENIPAEVRLDPWLADWKEFAQKTASSGFDRRRIKTAEKTAVTIFPNPGSLWIGYSCFAAPLETPDGEPLVLKAGSAPETWICKSGILRCGNGTWMYSIF
ncbi:MAG: hypothetical protein FWD78_00430 [Treponema sp.]|nr:hypothetical protein [Treponema sp.]